MYYPTILTSPSTQRSIEEPSEPFVPPQGESVRARSRGVPSGCATLSLPMWPALSRTRCTIPHTARTCRRVFGPHKRALKGRRFGADEDIKAAEVQWFHRQPGEFFAKRIHRLLRQWDVCLSASGWYFKGIYSFTHKNSRMDFV
jgi:hypothetical protein